MSIVYDGQVDKVSILFDKGAPVVKVFRKDNTKDWFIYTFKQNLQADDSILLKRQEAFIGNPEEESLFSRLSLEDLERVSEETLDYLEQSDLLGRLSRLPKSLIEKSKALYERLQDVSGVILPGEFEAKRIEINSARELYLESASKIADALIPGSFARF